MAEQSLTGKKVAFLLTDGVEQPELTSPKAAVEAAGGTVTIVSPKAESLQAMQGDWEHADHFDVDAQLGSVAADQFDALVLPGGTLNADTLRADEQAQAFASGFFEAGKPVAAICHGPWLLIEIDQVAGRRLTSVGNVRSDLVNAGAEWVDEPVVIDGQLITSRTPADLEAFNDAVVQAVAG